MKVGVFMCLGLLNEDPARSVKQEVEYFARFLQSLFLSDFPKEHTFRVIGPGYSNLFQARELFLPQSALENDFVLLADADMVVPPFWWGTVEGLFNSDPKIGLVSAVLSGDGFRCPGLNVEDYEKLYRSLTLTDEKHRYLPSDADWSNPNASLPRVLLDKAYFQRVPGPSLDQFTVFRSEMLRQIPYDNTPGWRLRCLDAGWKLAIAPGVIVSHMKGTIGYWSSVGQVLMYQATARHEDGTQFKLGV
ncbi:MAG TPA: hypothetical protein VGS11_00965 [Candidatus Bathyarchaeia archaeon]|nr:hypothetical protein [Candidatus Bathyarchaeia archaeon]